MINSLFGCLYGFDFCAYCYEFYSDGHPDILFEAFSTLRPVSLSKGAMLVKVLKIKDFYEFCLCSNTIVSMWHEEMKLLNHTCAGSREHVH